MPVRVSFCRNAGANRGKVVSSVVLKDSGTVAHLETMARHKLKLSKNKQVVLYEHFSGTQLTETNRIQLLTSNNSDNILNVSCGEAFLSPQGDPVLSALTADVPQLPRHPAPFGKVNDVPKPPPSPKIPHGEKSVDDSTSRVVYHLDGDPKQDRQLNDLVRSGCRRSPFADLSGDVLNRFKRLVRTNKFLSLKRHDEYISIDYTDISAFRNGNDLDLQECRGLVVSAKDGTVLARRFHKFFNVNETPDSSFQNDVSGGILLEKLDGYLVSPFLSTETDTIRWATRQECSMEVEELASNLEESDYESFARHWIEQKCTPMFECILRKQFKGVVSYNSDRLVLLAIRHMESGLYISWHHAISSAAQYNIPVARTIRRVQDEETMDGVLDFVRNHLSIAEEIEGVVLVLADGQRRYKIKTNWYLNRAKLNTVHGSIKSKNRLYPEVFSWDGLSSAHWAEIPNHFLWEVALWDWLDQEASLSDDMLPEYVHQLHKVTHCPVNVLLHFIETVRRNLVLLDQDLVVWASDARVQENQGRALQKAKENGWDLKMMRTYLSGSTETSASTLRSLAVFLWNKIVKKSEWGALRSTLCQSFVNLSDLSTDAPRLLTGLFLAKNNKEPEPVTIILRGLPNSGKSYFVRTMLAPFFSGTTMEVFSADDFFVDTNGRYAFEEARLSEAHAYCRSRFLVSTATVKVVDNTNSTLREYSFYKRKSPQSIVLEIHGRGPAEQENDHGVPPWILQRMKGRWEQDTSAIRVQNFRHCN
eukprot:scaffold11046_cov183-Amphora_coffeaeformis.AAC.3